MKPSSEPAANASGWQPSQFECNGEHAEAFYAALLAHSLFWNDTFTRENALEISVPNHGIDAGAFAKHSVAKIMITRRGAKGDNPRYGAPPLYYASCCDGFQDVYVADMGVALEWGLLQWAHDIHE